MLERLKSFFGSFPQKPAADIFGVDDPRVCAAALMFQIMEADGVRDAAEHAQMRAALTEAYKLSGHDLEKIVAAGDAAQREAIDLFSFTSVLNRELDNDAKLEFIGILWEMVYADGELHELEDNMVWRVAELIGVEQRERIEMRQIVRQRRGLDANKWDD